MRRHTRHIIIINHIERRTPPQRSVTAHTVCNLTGPLRAPTAVGRSNPTGKHRLATRDPVTPHEHTSRRQAQSPYTAHVAAANGMQPPGTVRGHRESELRGDWCVDKGVRGHDAAFVLVGACVSLSAFPSLYVPSKSSAGEREKKGRFRRPLSSRELSLPQS